MALTPRQARFVDEYLVDLNAGRAAVRAGYGAKTAYTAGPRLLRQARVAAAVKAGMEARSRRTGINADRVLTEYARMAFSDIRRAVSWRTLEPEEGDGPASKRRAATSEIQVLDSETLDDETSVAIAEISQAAGGALRVKMHDKKGALDSLARHLGLFDAREAAGKAVPAMEPDEMTERLSRLTPEQRAAIRAAIRSAVEA